MVWAGAVGMLPHEGSALADFGDGRVGVGVEEVVLREDLLAGGGRIFILVAESGRSLREA